jgi:mono/diheme cytochrome c family protein
MHRRTLTALTFAAGCLAAPLLVPFTGEAHPELPGVTWDEIAPLVAERCVGCHRTGGFATPPLETYEDAQRVAQAIKWSVLDRSMPPWRAASGFGDFANDPSLTATEVELLASWVDRGAQPGKNADVKATPTASDMEPDMVLRPRDDYRILSARQTFEVRLEDKGEHWLQGWQFRPGNAAAVTQADISIVAQGPLGTWLPPEGAVMLPDGAAYRLRSGAAFKVDVRYRKVAAGASDRSELALYFSDKPQWEARHLTLPCGTTRIPDDVRVVSIRPSLESFGDALEIVARSPDGAIAPLGWFRNYPPNFRASYRYREPVELAKATVIDVRSADTTCGVDVEYLAH